MSEGGINVLVLRRVRPACRADFEAAVRHWIPEAIRFPGHLGVFMLIPPPDSDEYGALLRFRDEPSWREFAEWKPYREFLDSVRPMLSEEPRTESMHGMEAWFRPDAASPPARWKMAVLTYFGVLFMVWLASHAVDLAWPGGPAWAVYLLINAVVVAGLTWIVMPSLTRLMQGWLRPRGGLV